MKLGALSVAIAAIGFVVSIGLSEDKPNTPTTMPAAKSEFVKMDANGDGKVSKEEFKAFIEAFFKAMDVNKDGKVPGEEFVAHRILFLDCCKTDKDGSVSMEAFVAAHVPADTKAGDDSKIPADIPKGKVMFAVIDLNGDGTITTDELAAWAVSRFKAQDTNNDKKLTKEERKAAAEKWHKIVDGDADGTVTIEELIIRWSGK